MFPNSSNCFLHFFSHSIFLSIFLYWISDPSISIPIHLFVFQPVKLFFITAFLSKLSFSLSIFLNFCLLSNSCSWFPVFYLFSNQPIIFPVLFFSNPSISLLSPLFIFQHLNNFNLFICFPIFLSLFLNPFLISNPPIFSTVP